MSREVLITLPKRGLKIIPPQETQQNMLRARTGEVVIWSNDEKKRLKLMINCSILAKRYPTPQDGQDFMQKINYEWGEELLGMAYEATDEIINQWQIINPNKNIAVLLYGSVAKGLVKSPDNPDPSNIDMAVIGDISPEERNLLLDAIRPKRVSIQNRILSNCPAIDSDEQNPGNLGISVQAIGKLTNNNFGQARGYITAGAKTLYDTAGIWQKIEQDALAQMDQLKKLNGKKKH